MKRLFQNLGMMKKLLLIFSATVFTLDDCKSVPVNPYKDAPVAFLLPLADLNEGDGSVIFVLNNVPSENVSNSGGWNYFITRASLTSAETLATSVLTVTAGGTANDTITLSVTNSQGTVIIGTATSAGGTVTALAVLLKNSINGGTATHGYTAANTAGALTVTAPFGSGDYINTVTIAQTKSTGATIAITNTSSFAGGVSAVYAASECISSQKTDPNNYARKINANVVDLNTCIAAYKASLYHAW